MKRRRFITLTGAGIVVAASSYVAFSHLEDGENKSIDYPQSLAVMMDAKTIIAIGTSYRKKFPDESNERILLKLLEAESVEDVKNISQLNKKITEDYKIGSIAVVNGWVLSITEARQCALFSIKKNN